MAEREIKTGDDVTDRLYSAAVDYVKAHGGTAVVVGGVGVIHEDRKYGYGLVVRFTGKPPLPEGGPAEELTREP